MTSRVSNQDKKDTMGGTIRNSDLHSIILNAFNENTDTKMFMEGPVQRGEKAMSKITSSV